MLEIGQVYDDLLCVEKVPNDKYMNEYRMRCTVCGREKNMIDHTVFKHCGTTHKACGKGLKTLDPVFYDRWQAMRTRTTNSNYHATHRYKDRGIDSEEFKYFIDFYDAMYDSYVEACERIGDPHNVSLERKDINKSYTKENCEWIDKHDQPKNTCKTTHFTAIDPDGNVYENCSNLTEFAREHGLDPGASRDALNGRISHHKHWKFYRIEKSEEKV